MISKDMPIMDYKLEDFILDDSFVNFATNINQADIAKWEEWFSQNPKNSKIALEAKILINKLRFHKQELPKEFVSEEWDKLSARLYLNEIKQKRNSKTIFLRRIGRYAAACILLFSRATLGFTLKHCC